ncbi:MAG: UvrB/UvrC motif-containing protein [Gemmataceae bacterium]|nr:UvrB/UvrC motif-containing protein [Gemmataceae bacterium]
MQKCQKCPNPATLHITEVLGPGQFDELHLCEQCANKYLYDGPKFGAAKAAAGGVAESEEAGVTQAACPSCGVKFVEFRNSGRLGCPHDYEVFRDDLVPLLENIHGEVKHCGKTPRRHPQSKELLGELMHLRNQLKHAVTKEDYEAAARLRDQIKQLEET